MIPKYRKLFNESFSPQKYQDFLDDITNDFDYKPTFRIAETPLFISNELKAKLIEGCNDVITLIKDKDFKSLTD